MSQPLDSVQITEGSTRLFIPREHSSKGPGKRIGRVFFNGQMAFNRDITLAFFNAIDMKNKSALDGMAATGARGLRVAHECDGPPNVVLNDRDSEAFRYIQANIELNMPISCEAKNEDLRALLTHECYDFIDIDPFGTPVPFISASVQGLKRKGVLAITATDTAPLAGTYAKKCSRRYMARPLRSGFGHETGLRILLGYLAREAAQFDRGVVPLLCFYADHYFRLYVRMPENAAAADQSLTNLGYLYFDQETGRRWVSKDLEKEAYGPIWIGPTRDEELLMKLKVPSTAQQPDRCAKYIDLWKAEVDLPFFYENNEISSLLKLSPPNLDAVITWLSRHGKASKTHFSPTGFKSDLPYEDILRLYPDIN